MGKLLKLNNAQKKLILQLEKQVESNISLYTATYSASALAELEYLVNEGFHTSLANAIAEDLFFGSNMEELKVFKQKVKEIKAAEVP